MKNIKKLNNVTHGGAATLYPYNGHSTSIDVLFCFSVYIILYFYC